MSRHRIILPLALLTAVAVSAACGGGSSGGSSASLESGDVAVVGDTHITQKQLDQLVAFQVNSAKVAKQKIPAAGTATYKTQVVDPILQRMITNAQVDNIAKQLGVTVSDSEVNAGLQKAIQAQFGTDTAKYQAYLKKYAITEDYLKQQLIRPQLLQTKIIAKLKSQYKVTDAQAQTYYNGHKSQYVMPETRKVHYILTKNQADANAARKALIQGASFPAEVKKYSMDASSNPSGALTARQGQVETNFANAVFAGLKTGGISPPVEVDSSYASSTFPGKCKPKCYFVIRADGDTVKGSQQSYAAVKAQILSQLEQSQQTPKLQKKIQSLLAAQKKLTTYAPAYKPAATASTSGGTSP
jgi:hypothetical protein